jgi:uncharacterized coiled-coil protein SlyX
MKEVKEAAEFKVAMVEDKVKTLEEENARLHQELAEYSGSVKDRLESLERMRDELRALVRKKKD